MIYVFSAPFPILSSTHLSTAADITLAVLGDGRS